MLRSWTFYELTRNPDVQARLHDEIMQKMPPGTVFSWHWHACLGWVSVRVSGAKLDMKSLSVSGKQRLAR